MVRYTIATNENGKEEYMNDSRNDNWFSDNIHQAVFFYNWRNIPFHVMEKDWYVVKVVEENGNLVVSKLTEEEMKIDF